MTLQRPLIVAASLALAAAQTPAFAQGAAPAKPAAPAGAAQPSKEQIEDAAFELRVLASALNSDKVEAPVKEALFGCLYNNNFAKISEAIDKVIAQNPGKIAKRNPDQVLGVMAGICGYRPKEAAAGASPAPAKPAPQPAKPGTSGR